MFATIPSVALAHIHGDPEQPVGALSDSAMLGSLPAQAVEAFVAATGPGSGSALLAAELRHLGGALAEPSPGHGALARLDAEYVVFGVGIAMDAAMAAKAESDSEALVGALLPWANGRNYSNLAERPTNSRSFFDPGTYARLQTSVGSTTPTASSRPITRSPRGGRRGDDEGRPSPTSGPRSAVGYGPGGSGGNCSGNTRRAIATSSSSASPEKFVDLLASTTSVARALGR
jgi:hypothetical protein